MKSFKQPFWTNSSILSFRTIHSSVEWPYFRWYLYYLIRSAWLWEPTGVGSASIFAWRVSSSMCAWLLCCLYGVECYPTFEVSDLFCNLWKSSHEVLQWFVVGLPQFICATDIIWWGRHVVNWAPKRSANVLNVLIVRGWSWCHHVRAGPFRELRKTLHKIMSLQVNRFNCVIYAFKCSSGSMVSSY